MDTSSIAGSSASGIPAGYGRSCTSCSRAKCRCMLRPEGGKCDRCHRLGKECQPTVTARKRTVKRSTVSRTAQLEEKLDDLVSILRASQRHTSQPLVSKQTLPHREQLGEQQQQQQQQQAIIQPLKSHTSSSAAGSYQPLISRLSSLADAAAVSTSTTKLPPRPCTYDTAAANCRPSPTDSASSDVDDPSEPTPEEAEAYLVKFRQWLKRFPFMILNPDITAENLRQERPFLWLCIMNITTMSLPQQVLLREKVRQELGRRAMSNFDRNLDMLLGLIAYLSWASMNSGPGMKPYVILYSQMATAAMYELGLSRSPDEDHTAALCFRAWTYKALPPSKGRTMEERRATISLWFVTSICSSFIGRMEALRWTAHMEESLEILEREMVCPSDEVLVTLVKIQLIGEESRQLLIRDLMGKTTQTPTYVYKKSLHTQLDAIRKGLSPGLSSCYMVQTHLYGTESQVHSIGLLGSDNTIPHGPRVDGMYASTMAAKAFYNTFFSLPLPEYPGLPFTVFVQMSQMQALLYRFNFVNDPAWDKQFIRSTLDLLVCLDQTIDLFQNVGAIYPMKSDGGDETSIFTKGAKILRHVRTCWEPYFVQSSTSSTGGIPTPSSEVVAVVGHQPAAASDPGMMIQNVMMTDHPADFNDLVWMSDVFGLWDC